MKATKALHDLGQSIWLDNITRQLLDSGTLAHYIDELSVTGLTSNPTIFDHAIKNSKDYDAAILEKVKAGKSGEPFSSTWRLRTSRAPPACSAKSTTGRRGSTVLCRWKFRLCWRTIRRARSRRRRNCTPALDSQISYQDSGTKEGLPAIEEAIFAGVPINVTLLFSANQYIAAAEAYMRGIERRIEAGLNPVVGSVASVFISRWDGAVASKVPDDTQE